MAFSLNFNDLFKPATQPQWMQSLLTLMTTLGVPATAWQSGSVARTMLTIFSYLGASEDALISIAAQGGFLDFAATGTVVYTALSGQVITLSVTPDPSTLTGTDLSNWTPGWLDVLADGGYNVQRLQATYASGPIAFTNTTGNSFGPYAANTLRVANPATGATYVNTASVTIPAQVVVGTISSISNPNGAAIVITTSAAHGLSSGQTVYLTGITGQTGLIAAWVVTVQSATTFSLNGAVGNGVASTGGTVYGSTVGTFQADVAGAGGTSQIGGISTSVTSLLGVRVYNTAAFTGSGWESNVQLAARCRLKLQASSPNGPPGAYQYFALTANQIISSFKTSALAALTLALSQPVTRVKVVPNPGLGVVTTTVANAAGAVTGNSNLAVTGATNASPIVITTSGAHGLTTGNYANVSGVNGNTAANGFWQVTSLSPTTFSLNGSTGNGSYISGGSAEASDLGLVDYVIQGNCVPNGVTAVTQSATAQNVAVVATVYVPQSQVAAYQTAAQTALAAYFAAAPIGGFNTDGGTNLLPIDAVIGVLYSAGIVAGTSTSYVRGVTGVTLNGGTIDLSIGATSVPVLSPAPAITVVGQ